MTKARSIGKLYEHKGQKGGLKDKQFYYAIIIIIIIWA